MIIIDTSIWIEALRGDKNYVLQIKDLVLGSQILVLEPIFAELLQGAKTDTEREFIFNFWETASKINEKYFFIQAGLESGKANWKSKGLSLIDAYIIAVAKHFGYKIWTLDKKIIEVAGKNLIY